MKFEQNRMVQTGESLELLDKNGCQSVDANLEDVTVTKMIVSCYNLKIPSYSVPKSRYSNTSNQVKSCTKHGRHDRSHSYKKSDRYIMMSRYIGHIASFISDFLYFCMYHMFIELNMLLSCYGSK